MRMRMRVAMVVAVVVVMIAVMASNIYGSRASKRPGTAPSAFMCLIFSIFTLALGSRCYYYFHFIDE